MTLHTEAGLSTGSYVVTRATGGTWVQGRWQRTAPATLVIEADVQASALQDDDQPQGQETSETRTLWTDSALFVSRPTPDVAGQPGEGLEADLIQIDGEPWVVTAVAHHNVVSGHYRATVERLYTRRAT